MLPFEIYKTSVFGCKALYVAQKARLLGAPVGQLARVSSCHNNFRTERKFTTTNSSQPFEFLKECLNNDHGFPKMHESVLVSDDTISNFMKSYKTNLGSDKTDFFIHLCNEFGFKGVNEATKFCSQLISEPEEKSSSDAHMEKLRIISKPHYFDLFTMIGRLNDGVKFLINFRSDVNKSIRNCTFQNDKNQLKMLSGHLKEVLSLWCSPGLLELVRVDWNTSASLLEKVGTNEAVHYVRNWLDLKHRLAHDRRCFTLLHPAVPNEPLVVLHVALTSHISDSVDLLIRRRASNNNDDGEVSTAIFYSITSTQSGLRGIDFGIHMIRKAVGDLRNEFPNLTKFSSLSPIPGFTKWMKNELSEELKDNDDGVSSTTLISEQDSLIIKQACGLQTDNEMYEFLLGLPDNGEWRSNEQLVDQLSGPLQRLCARYLHDAKNSNGYAYDPVANFHLRNGAVMWRLNWMADTSLRGYQQSLGMMVNYRYYLDKLGKNSRAYLMDRQINISSKMDVHL